MLRIQKAAVLTFMLVFILCGSAMPVQAANSMIGITDQWDGLDGDARYLGQKYRDNYGLDQDAGKLDIIEKAGNGLANVFWGLCTTGTQVGCAVIYYAMDFNLAELVGDKLNALEASLVNNIFNRIFPLAFLGIGCMLIYRLWKRDVIGGFSDVAKTVILVCISIGLSINASSILTLTSNLTKQVNQTIMSGINGQSGFSSDQKDFAKEAAGILWTDMVHIPWMTLEFGDNEVSPADVERILASKGDERTDIIKELSDDMDSFDASRCWTRLGNVLLYLFPWLAKLVVFTLISALQIAFQAAVLLLFSTAPIVLIITLVSASGFNLIKRWAGTLLDFHISMISLSFLLSILIWIDKLLFSQVQTYGWFIVVLLQTAICVFLLIKRDMILGFLVAGRGHGVSEAVGRAINQPWEASSGDKCGVNGAVDQDYQDERIINDTRNTSFTEAYNASDDEENTHENKYNSSMDSSSMERSDSSYRKEKETMNPQSVYETFQDTGEPEESSLQDQGNLSEDMSYDMHDTSTDIDPAEFGSDETDQENSVGDSSYNTTSELPAGENYSDNVDRHTSSIKKDFGEDFEEPTEVCEAKVSNVKTLDPEYKEPNVPQGEIKRPDAQEEMGLKNELLDNELNTNNVEVEESLSNKQIPREEHSEDLYTTSEEDSQSEE